jgi:ribonuclease T2
MLRRLSALAAFRHALIGLALVATAAALFPQVAAAQYRPQTQNQTQNQDRYGRLLAERPAAQTTRNQPGQFDFYVLALSWSPSFCEASGERAASRTPDQQCEGRPYAFVVHGLWPQFERGFPQSCQQPSPRLARTIADSMLDLMPSPRLVYHEWDRHGTCTGLDGAGYFGAVRAARGKIEVPEQYRELTTYTTVSPTEVADAFVKSNPGLSRDSLAVTCDDKRLTGVRICMNKDFGFRACGEIARRSCTREQVVMPPLRGPRAANAN